MACLSLELKGGLGDATATPRRTLRDATSSNLKTVDSTNSTKTPVRNLKRARSAYYESNYDDVVQTEFYRVFSDTSRKTKPSEPQDYLSFLFRGPTNSIVTSTVGMYGEIAHASLKAVCKKLVEYGLDDKSVVLDLGSGRGVPNFIFASNASPFSSIGIEKCPIAYLNSVNNMCILISKDIRSIKSEIRESPIRSLDSPYDSDARSSRSGSLDYNSDSASSTICTVSGDEEYSFSPSTQVEDDPTVYDENSATPSRFLSAPKLQHELDLEELQQGLTEFKNRLPTLPLAFVNEDIIAYDSFEGVTHFYSFDIAMERALINNMVYQFKNTSTAYVFASFISDLMTSFDLSGCFLGAKIPCKMYGSGEGKTCYVYVKNDWKAIKKAADRKLLKAFDLTNPSKRRKAAAPKLKPDLDSLKFSVNNYEEPFRTLDIIKLSKLPLYYQYMWYLKKLNRFYSGSATRSKSYSENLREALASERDLLIEQIAHAGPASEQLRQRLKRHITANFREHSSFP